MPMSLSSISSSSQACAACKYQRRKCAPDCALAPYFPHDRQKQFLNAHKLFGVSNITKIIKDLQPPAKEIAMKTIIYQSDTRAKDPVGGCCRTIQTLQCHIAFHQAKLEFLLQQIALCGAHQESYQQQQQEVEVSGENEPPGSYDFFHNYNDTPSSFQVISVQHDQEYMNVQKQQQQQQQQQSNNHEDNGKGKRDTPNQHRHLAEDFQHSWGLQDSNWIESKGSCTEGSPLEGENDQVGELKLLMDHSVNLIHDHLEMVTFEEGEFFKFDPQATIESREMTLKVENATLDDEEPTLSNIQFQSMI